MKEKYQTKRDIIEQYMMAKSQKELDYAGDLFKKINVFCLYEQKVHFKHKTIIIR